MIDAIYFFIYMLQQALVTNVFSTATVYSKTDVCLPNVIMYTKFCKHFSVSDSNLYDKLKIQLLNSL